MTAIVVPFRGATGKRRLRPLPAETRRALALAMLGDVLAAATLAGDVLLVTSDRSARMLASELGTRIVDDLGGGQSEAVAAGLEHADGQALVVNADCPCVVPRDLRSLEAAIPAGGIALVEATDGTTNALGLAHSGLFAALYGPGSAARFRKHAERIGVELVSASIQSLVDDVDEVADLERLGLCAGPRTLAAVAPARELLSV